MTGRWKSLYENEGVMDNKKLMHILLRDVRELEELVVEMHQAGSCDLLDMELVANPHVRGKAPPGSGRCNERRETADDGSPCHD